MGIVSVARLTQGSPGNINKLYILQLSLTALGLCVAGESAERKLDDGREATRR